LIEEQVLVKIGELIPKLKSRVEGGTSTLVPEGGSGTATGGRKKKRGKNNN
jgi:hypothetical protein